MTKYIMTRQEAIELMQKHIPMKNSNAENILNFYIEAEMLEIKEEPFIDVNIIDAKPVVVKRHGRIIYDER